MAFIVFEGIDGAGKSTLMRLLSQHLESLKMKYILTREPGGTALAEAIRQLIVSHSADAPVPRAELLLYEAARAQHVEKLIRPKLAESNWVLCDRFTASTVAFQGAGRALLSRDVEWLNQFAIAGIKPDLNVLLDLGVSESFRRRQLREKSSGQAADRIESESASFHELVANSFRQQAQLDPQHWLVLNAELTPQQLSIELIEKLRILKWLN